MKKIVIVLVFAALVVVMAMTFDKPVSQDHGRKPWVVDIEKLTVDNTNFRAVSWTGEHMQLTIQSIKPGGEIGMERHDGIDQFIRVEQGEARVVMGLDKNQMTFDEKVSADWAILVPAGYWHNVINAGDSDLKVYALYAPPEHKPGTLHKTSEDSEADHHHH